MNSYYHYVMGTVLSTKARKALAGLFCVVILVLLVFLEPIQSLLFRKYERNSLMFPQLLLLCIAMLVCIIIETGYIKSPEYQYLRSMPLSNGVRIAVLATRMLYMIAFYASTSVLLWDGQEYLAIVQLAYSSMMLLAVSTAIANVIILTMRCCRRSKGTTYAACILLVFSLVLFFICIFSTDFRLVDFRNNTTIRVMHNVIVKPNLAVALPCFVWLALLYRREAPYELFISQRKRGIKKPFKHIIKGIFRNTLYKDVLVSKGKPSFICVVLIYMILGFYLAKYRMDASVNIVVSIVFTIILSTLSEEIMKSDMLILPLVRSFPIRQKAFYWAKIASVSTVLTLPSLVFITIVAGFSSFTIWMFLLALGANAALGYLWCAMQCIVVFDNIHKQQRIQLIMIGCVFVSFVLPVFPLLYVVFRAKHAEKVFCGGRS